MPDEEPAAPVSDPPAHAFLTPSDECSSTELRPPVWNKQCENADYALFCKSDKLEKRCACRKNGRYYWTYGSKCDSLPCYTQKCP